MTGRTSPRCFAPAIHQVWASTLISASSKGIDRVISEKIRRYAPSRKESERPLAASLIDGPSPTRALFFHGECNGHEHVSPVKNIYQMKSTTRKWRRKDRLRVWMCIVKVVQRNSCWNQNAQAQLQVNVRSILLKFSALQLVSTLKSRPRLLVQNAVSSHALFFLTELPGELPVILKRRKPK